MKAADLEKASKILAELRAVERDLEMAKTAVSFKLEMKATPTSYVSEDVGHCDGVSETASGSYGELAKDLRAAAVAYYAGHAARMKGELVALGVDL